jgi:DNA-damage-inducible protein D
MTDLDRFDAFDFEHAQNGSAAWHEERLMEFLGYKDPQSFRKLVLRAMQACISTGLDPSLDFINGGSGYKLTRFACYLIAMNGDTRKPQVAAAKVYFAKFADVVHNHFEQAATIERVLGRDELTDGTKALCSTAKNHGVYNYALFMDAGYRGMYNMGLADLRRVKGVPFGENLLDRMDRPELAANWFRVTQTDEKIKNESVRGQDKCEEAAFDVGEAVRRSMLNISGTLPEDLPIAPTNIKESRKAIKDAGKNLKAIEKLPKRTRMLNTISESAEEHPGFTIDPEEDDEGLRDGEHEYS